jgi:hypothetical protein
MNTTLSLRRKIVVILAIKLIALVSIYYLFFGPAHRIKVDPAEVQTRFYSGGVDNSSGEK